MQRFRLLALWLAAFLTVLWVLLPGNFLGYAAFTIVVMATVSIVVSLWERSLARMRTQEALLDAYADREALRAAARARRVHTRRARRLSTASKLAG
jgi:hypothetical protein